MRCRSRRSSTRRSPLHRLRSTWQATRTARLNTVRGLLREFGLGIPVGAEHGVPRVREWLAASTTVPDLIRTSLASACDEVEVLETNMRAVERQLTMLARDRAAIVLLRTIPGVGLLTATALVALVGDIRRFPSSRHFASVLGLTPKEDSSALRERAAPQNRGRRYVSSLIRCRRGPTDGGNQPRPSARVKALRSPAAVRYAQP